MTIEEDIMADMVDSCAGFLDYLDVMIIRENRRLGFNPLISQRPTIEELATEYDKNHSKYCNECELWEDKKRISGIGRLSLIFSPTTDTCFHVLNMTGRKAYLAVMYKLINHPEEINKDNNCGWFVKKRGFLHRLFKGRHKDRIGSGKEVHLPEWDSPPPRKTADDSKL